MLVESILFCTSYINMLLCYLHTCSCCNIISKISISSKHFGCICNTIQVKFLTIIEMFIVRSYGIYLHCLTIQDGIKGTSQYEVFCLKMEQFLVLPNIKMHLHKTCTSHLYLIRGIPSSNIVKRYCVHGLSKT